jgi:long-chain acyl-CoA synthetase
VDRPVPAGVYDVLAAALAADPAAPALVTRSGALSYAELDRRADRAAAALWDLGVRPGDRVAASWPNDEPIVVAFHAAMRLGAIWVGINAALAPPEKEYVLSDCGASLALVGEADAEVLAGRTPARPVLAGEWAEAVAAAPDHLPVGAPDPEAPAAIAYTSGTTGFPKGAVHCQAGLVLPGAATVARRGWGPGLRKGDSRPRPAPPP